METTFPKTSNPGIKTSTQTPGGASSTSTEASGAAHGLVDRVTGSAHDTVDRVVAKAAPALDRARDAASDLKTSAYTKWDDFINSEDKAESARSQIREHPLAVVAIALVAGVIIGRL